MAQNARGLAFARKGIVYKVFEFGSFPNASVCSAHARILNFDNHGERIVEIFFLVERWDRNLYLAKTCRTLPRVKLRIEYKGGLCC